MSSCIGRALTALEHGLAAKDGNESMAWRYGRALGAMEVARDLLLRIDPADVAKWLDNECCVECGVPDVAMLDNAGAPYCARHATALRQSEDRDVEDAR